MDGRRVEQEVLDKIADVFKGLVPGLDGIDLFQPAVVPAVPPTFADPELIDVAFDDRDDVAALVRKTQAALLQLGLVMKIEPVSQYKGKSVHLVFRVERADAERVEAAFDHGLLDRLGVKDVRIVPRRRLTWYRIGVTLSCAGSLLCVAGQYEPISVPASVAGFACASCGLLCILGRAIYARLKK